ncbi:Fe2+-dependent dioxygenase [Neisseriaceae bacterium JH1-16]|nr:Fe2+-dependent dioxygenase [Neisseriaceae bacterium JH1-16]
MLIHIPRVLGPAQLAFVRDRLDRAGEDWVDGRVTAGYQSASVKHNQQLAENSPLANELGDLILAALEQNPLFISTVLPDKVYPPLFNRYAEGMNFGSHVDGSVRINPGNGRKLRTDVSATLFISEPHEYDGGELMIEDTYGAHSVKLAAGDMVVYPATSLHRVNPVTRGARLASFFWVQSMVRDDAQRTLLYDLDSAIQALAASQAEGEVRTRLVGCYHNLMRMWGEV